MQAGHIPRISSSDSRTIKYTRFQISLNLADLDKSTGLAIVGAAQRSLMGRSVSGAGDINGDGVDDVVIGSRVFSTGSPAYVIFGSQSALPDRLAVFALDGSNGFAIDAASSGDNAGDSVSSAGDINAIIIDDLIVGAPSASPNGFGSGAAYVIFGTRSGFSSPFQLSALNGTNGFVIHGVLESDALGGKTSCLGDVNADGIDDLAISAPIADPNGSVSGATYVVFGSGEGFSSPLELSTLDGNNGFVINGAAASDRSGRAVSGAGDYNGDGIDDLIIGADQASPNADSAGASYVVFGRSGGFPGVVELAELNGATGLTINGELRLDSSGRSVGAAGDFNADGLDDVIVGAPGTDPNGIGSGTAFVVYGRTDQIFASGFESQLPE